MDGHVSLGWHAARKLRTSVDNLRRVLAIELAAAARAVDLRAPLKPSEPAQRVIVALREKVAGPGPDRFLAPAIEATEELLRTGELLAAAGPLD